MGLSFTEIWYVVFIYFLTNIYFARIDFGIISLGEITK